MERELRSDILPFWLNHAVDREYGGFRGHIDNDLTVHSLAHKGLVLNARILWSFSKAYEVYRDQVYLETAARAFDYLRRQFWDAEFGGVHWMLDYRGNPVDTKKRIYGQAFTVYALAEYACASSEKEALEEATELFRLIEDSAYDAKNGGYFETYERDWKLAHEQRLSEVDLEEKKSMNTHLHLLEAYANLLRVWDDAKLRRRLRELAQIFLDRIIDPNTRHLRMFFDEEWRDRSKVQSFGHDIEGSWLLCEAAGILGENELLERVRNASAGMARAVYDEALDEDGGLFYEGFDKKITDSDKHWWPQAEAVVGFLNAFELTGNEYFLRAAKHSWEFIDKYIVDHQRGEWYGKVSRTGLPAEDKEKAGPWKCPYHNSRMCFEVMRRLDKPSRGP
jgi:cellobiose epimerase